VSGATNKTRVLVFCRPYLLPDFLDNVAPLRETFEFRFLTDGRSPGVADTRERFYQRLGTATQAPDLSADAEHDVLRRCRYLRNLPSRQAISMLRAMASVLSEELDTFGPAVVLSHMVDDYITHLLAELSRRRGAVFVGYAYSYFPGKIQATKYGYGEPHDLRTPPDAEVQQTLDVISQRTFRQNYLQKDTYTRTRHALAMLRYRVKQVVFRLKAWRDRDPLHMHYGSLPYVVERRHWRDFPSAADFHGNWRQRVGTAPAASGRRPIIYFPLGYFPEATIDYWIENLCILEYESVVLRIVALLGQHFQVVVKEHLHMLGARSPVFYRALRDTPGVVSVPPLEFSNDVMGMSDLVLMGAGSVGVEAYIRGKPIASYCDRSYWFRHARAAYVDLARMPSWPDIIASKIGSHSAPCDAERFEFVRRCLSSTMRVQRPGQRWPICEPQDLRQAIETAVAEANANRSGHAKQLQRAHT
jgi:hypothetical protein